MKKKSFAVLGLGKFGAGVAREMARIGADVLAVDLDEENVHMIADEVTCAMKADVCDNETLQTLGLSNMDAVVVAITESLDASIMATIFAKEAGVPIVVAKARDAVHAKILEKVGADRTIIPEKESGIRMARCLISGNFIDVIELSDHISIVAIQVKPEWAGKSLSELRLREKAGMNIIALRAEGELTAAVDPNMPLKPEYTMWVMVDKKNLEKLF